MRSSSIVGPFLLAIAAGCGDDPAGGDADAAIEPAPDASVEPDAEPAPEPGIAFHDFHIAVDLTPDGRIAVFELLTETDALVYFVDTVTGEATEQTSVGDPSRAIATGISATGRLSALHGEPVQAGLWTEAGGWIDLGSPHAAGCGESDIGSAFDISADGHVAVGLAWDGCVARAFRWSDAGGAGEFVPLDTLGVPAKGSSNPPNSRVTVIADDGTTMAGFAQNDFLDRSAAVWRADGTGYLLDPGYLDAPSEILSISGDGKTLAGVRGFDGFVWTVGTGIVPLLRLESALPSDPVFPNAIAADGALIFGGLGSAFFGNPVAFVWTAQGGMRPLAEVAAAAGVTVPEGMSLQSVLAASADGTVTIGTAVDVDFNPKTFVLRLPAGAFGLR